MGGQRLERLVHEGAAAGMASCPVCGARGIMVTEAVIKSMVNRGQRNGLPLGGFSFCAQGNCPLVYYDNIRRVYLGRNDVNKPVTIKDPGPDVPVCYCLRVNRRTIVDAVARGDVRSSQDAKRVTKACTGKACHIVNPAGTCCGDQLRDTVATALEWVGADEAQVQAAQNEDPGATCCGRTLGRALAGENVAGTASVHGEDSCCAVPVNQAEAPLHETRPSSSEGAPPPEAPPSKEWG